MSNYLITDFGRSIVETKGSLPTRYDPYGTTGPVNVKRILEYLYKEGEASLSEISENVLEGDPVKASSGLGFLVRTKMVQPESLEADWDRRTPDARED